MLKWGLLGRDFSRFESPADLLCLLPPGAPFGAVLGYPGGPIKFAA